MVYLVGSRRKGTSDIDLGGMPTAARAEIGLSWEMA